MNTKIKRKAGRPNRGLVAKNISLFDHQHAALERIADKHGRTFPELLRSALDELNEELADVEFTPSMQGTIKVTRNHVTKHQDEELKRLAKKTGATMAHLTRAAIMKWLDQNKR